MADFLKFDQSVNISQVNNLPEALFCHWRKLALTTAQTDPFSCGPEWQLAWLDVMKPGSSIHWAATDSSLVIFQLVVEFGKPVMLLPLECGWCFGNPLMGPDAPQLLDLLMDHINLAFNGFLPVVAVLSGVRPDEASFRDLKKHFEGGYAFPLQEKSSNATASLLGGVDGWLRRRSANHRAKLKKAAKKAASLGMEFERHMPQTPEDVDFVYERMLSVEARSWKGIGKCGMAESPMREFYRALMLRLCPRHGVRVIFARLYGEDIGFIFGSTLDHIYRGQQFSFDQRHAELSVGNLMQLETVKWLCEDNFVRYDMGIFDNVKMAYKEHWTELLLPSEVRLMAPPYCLH